MAEWAARALLLLMRVLQALPLALQAAIGNGLGRLLHACGGARRRIALRNVELCLPELDPRARARLVREHFGWLGRSMLERSLLWHASRERLLQLIRVEGDVHLAERSARPVMWLVPHFLGLDVAGAATQLYQTAPAFDVYAPQSNKVFDAALLQGRSRFGTAEFINRKDGARAIVRAIRRGLAFFNPADMDFGLRDSAFVPFFGHPAATLLAPSRIARSLDMVVQPLVAEILPGGGGWVVRFGEPWTDWPTDDPLADAARMNRYIEEQIRLCPAQYLWVHKRFKTRPEGAPPVYD
ncbi:MAG: lipid A biosynthesis acyltransferase [Burkholderiales bacterium]|nr:lipid A biosynthesis acyltransferase [Burkholderiales bacterium]MDE1925802.1 lipid A biosynthesis acyltransferase [Burkholderiales bacterium]MDE2157290.1 lipid A biosynthesis acyltransferase [Burkholderiales bacterium]MDE2501543.1 lipid A biosynthesis acyltransferase [Burkholderiales bacterium]